MTLDWLRTQCNIFAGADPGVGEDASVGKFKAKSFILDVFIKTGGKVILFFN